MIESSYFENTPVRPVQCQTMEELTKQAAEESVSVSGIILYGTAFKQGTRYFFLAPIRYSMLDELIYTERSKKGKKRKLSTREVELLSNRPEDRNHTKSIQQYLEDNGTSEYILPPITLNVPEGSRVSLYLRETSAHVAMAVLVIPHGIKLLVTDGQHRVNAINDTIEYLVGDELGEQLKQDYIGVMVTFESMLTQVHQDFADCSRTKQLSQSQISVYDQRNAANSVVLELEKLCPIFSGHVDASGKSVSKEETNRIWLVNWLRQMIKGLLFSGVNMSNLKFEEAANKKLDTKIKTEEAKQRCAMFVNYLTERLDPWKQMLDAWNLPENDPERVTKIKKLRQEYLCFTVTALNVLGYVGYELLERVGAREDWKLFVDQLAKLDWRKDAPMWQGLLVQNGRIVTQHSTTKDAVRIISQEIGLVPKPTPEAVPVTV